MEDYIISCVRSLDNPLTPQAQGYTSDLLYLGGRSDDILQRERDELLSATLADVNAIGENMQECVSSRAYCTVGSGECINACADLFDEVIKL